MKLILQALICACLCSKVLATDAIYINDSPTANPPPIDARAFLNRSIFTIDSPSIFTAYNTKNTSAFTNAASGTMSAINGFQFLLVTNSVKKPALSFYNEGVINGGAYLEIKASNIFNSGPMSVNSQGRLVINGGTLNLNRNGLRAGDLAPTGTGIPCSYGFYGTSNYFNDAGIADVWWGRGTNNYMNGQGQPVNLQGLAANISPPFYVSSPLHQVIYPPFSTNLVTVGGFGFAPFVYTKQVSPTRKSVQIVLVQTNVTGGNVRGEARFYNTFGAEAAVAAVCYSSEDYDVVLQRNVTNTVCLLDASAVDTNVFLARNSLVSPATRRPNPMEVMTRLACEFRYGSNANTAFDPALIYNNTYASNTVPVLYSGYAVSINTSGNSLFVSNYVNPTTLPGTIEIVGDNVSLDQTRIRAENTVAIKTANLVSNKVAVVDAPYLVYDLTSTRPELVISNLAPATIRRVSGSLEAYSATWVNYENGPTETNEVRFHLLIVQNNMTFEKPAVVDSLSLKAPSIVMDDRLYVQTSLRLDTANLTVRRGLDLPLGSTWASTNILNIVNYTNQGTVNIYKAAFFGTDRPQPYNSFVNQGTHIAAAHLINTYWFDNRGLLQSSNGTLSVSAGEARLAGVPVVYATNYVTNLVWDFETATLTNEVITNIFHPVMPSKLAGNGDVYLGANYVTLSNAIVQAGGAVPGRFDLAVTNQLVDSGQGAINNIYASAGMNLLVKPGFSDLMATYVTCKAPENAQVFNTWAGEDRGATVNGFNNNGAIGKLTLDGGRFSLFRFAAPNGQTGRALYVEYLELLNNATNYLTGAFSIDPNITIYFANSNETAEKLDGSNSGRIRWVKSYTGPLSSTNIVYPSGQVVTMNVALATSKNVDSDCDGTVNADDATPIYSSDQAILTATRSGTNKVALSWTAVCGSTSWIEYKTSFTQGSWLPLTTYVNSGMVKSNVTYLDTAVNSQRIYRLRVNPPQP